MNVYALGSHGFSALSFSKLIAFVILVAYNYRNHRLIDQQLSNGGNVVRGMVLPLYSEYMYLLLAETLVFGVLNIVDADRNDPSHQIISIPVQLAVEQSLYVYICIYIYIL